MAEEELQYASVQFKSNKEGQQKVKEEREETVYVEIKMPKQQTDDTTSKISLDKNSDSKRHNYQHLACGLGILSFLLAMGIVVFCVYVDTLYKEKEKLQKNEAYFNLSEWTGNLTRACSLLERKISSLTTDIYNLTMDKLELTRLNQALEKETQNLTEELIREHSNELNVSRAQWSIENYCPQSGLDPLVTVKVNADLTDDAEIVPGPSCKKCPTGWLNNDSSCYAIVNGNRNEEWRSWNKAQEDCKIKSSDLVVISSDREQNFVREHSWISSPKKGYWIGLRANAGKWKWVDGSEFRINFLTDKPPVEGQCGMAYENEITSVSCDERQRWICEKKAIDI